LVNGNNQCYIFYSGLSFSPNSFFFPFLLENFYCEFVIRWPAIIL